MKNPYYFPVLFFIFSFCPKTLIWVFYFCMKNTKNFLRAKNLFFKKLSKMKNNFKNEKNIQFLKSLLLSLAFLWFSWKKRILKKELFFMLKNSDKNTNFFAKYFLKSAFKKVLFKIIFSKLKQRGWNLGKNEIKKTKIFLWKTFLKNISRKSHFCIFEKSENFFWKKYFFWKKLSKVHFLFPYY